MNNREVAATRQGQIFGPNTYAQHGDDLILACLFDKLKVPHPSYLDIGAFDPITLSNTWLLYQRGSSGICVDANPKALAHWKRQRPRDRTACIGIGTVPGKFPFYVVERGPRGCSSFLWEKATRTGYRVYETMVPVTTITALVAEYCSGKYPDLLSLDIEGLEPDVIATIDCNHPQDMPKVVICEALIGTPESRKVRELLENRGYTFIIRARHNAIFVANEYREMLY